MFTVTKSYKDFPAAHRQPQHQGHCRLIHGHNWGWDITFGCDALDENRFVVDVGELKEIKAFLTKHFDHTLLLNDTDPQLSHLREQIGQLAEIVAVPSCGMEGLAEFVFNGVQSLLVSDKFLESWNRNLRVVQVVCWEDSKNCATYQP